MKAVQSDVIFTSYTFKHFWNGGAVDNYYLDVDESRAGHGERAT